MAGEAPPAYDRLREQHPGPARHRGVAGGGRNQIGELADHGELLFAVERPGIREHLHPHVVPVSIDVRERAAR